MGRDRYLSFERKLLMARRSNLLHVVLLRPAIAGNAGTIARTCHAFGARLHVVAPAFDVARDTAAKRGAVGYWPGSSTDAAAGEHVAVYADERDFAVRGLPLFDAWVLFSKRSRHGSVDARTQWRVADDLARAGGAAGGTTHIALAFGSESDGLDRVDPSLLGIGRSFRCGVAAGRVPPRAVYLPMAPGVRSLNLGVAASIALWEAARQLGDGHDAASAASSAQFVV